MSRITKSQKENILKVYKMINREPKRNINKLTSKEASELYKKLLKELTKTK